MPSRLFFECPKARTPMKSLNPRPIASDVPPRAGAVVSSRLQTLTARVRLTRWPAATVLAAASVVLPSAQAGGRPLTVDDAGISAPGEGEIEAWWEGGTRHRKGAVVAAPSYTAKALPSLEWSAALSRDRDGHSTLQGAAIKWLWTQAPANEGCNAASSVGLTRVRHEGDDRTGMVNLIATCLASWGAVHGNVGASRVPHASWQPSWGVALEGPDEVGSITPLVEAFGTRHGPTTLQTGFRWAWSEAWNLNATIGLRRGETVLSVGLRRGF